MNIDDFKIEHTFFTAPVKNIVIEGSNFIKLIYSNELTTLSCIYLQVPFHLQNVERYFNKLKYSFDPNNFHNKKLIEKIYLIEKSILEKINIYNKKPVLHLYDKLSRGCASLNAHYSSSQSTSSSSSSITKRCLFLKISGIWETDYNYGLTFKFV